ncbi:MAG: DNA topoisomerase [Candidatus Hodarchaeota archaeon]
MKSNKKYSKLVSQVLQSGNLTPVQGKKDDPAHPAIHPTGTKATRRLTPSENKVYDIVVRRFLALFGESAVKESLRADISSGEHLFYLRGLKILKEGWMELYGPYVKHNEKLLPPIKAGDQIHLMSVKSDDRFTKPPARLNPSSLLKILEKENLGTKATRASIVDSVRSRGYTLGDNFELSTLGHALFETLEQYVPRILSPEFTRQLQQQMDQILEEKIDRQQVLDLAKGELTSLLTQFEEQEAVIGNALVTGLQRYWKAKEEIGTCPKCSSGTLLIIRSPRTGKRFVGCSDYKEGKCDQTFPLPQKGAITPLNNSCPHCGYHMIKIASGRRTWETCINWTTCPGRQDDLRALQERRSKKETSKKEGEDDD